MQQAPDSRVEPQAGGEVLLVDFGAGDHGHHGQYNAMLKRLFRMRPTGFSLGVVIDPAPVLYPQIEAAPFQFAMAAVLRGMLGRRTVGFLLRPLPALKGKNPRLILKRIALWLLRRIAGVQVLTIIPFAIEPQLDCIAAGWIHDLQNWDLQLEHRTAPPAADGALSREITDRAGGRPVCCAIGRQEIAKGFDRFAGIYGDDEALRDQVLFAFGGSVAPELKALAGAFAAQGGFALDRFVSDAELLELYAAADLIWCVYAPDYDQASGVLGRAMQLGIPVAARRGSVIAAICANEGHPCIEIDEDHAAQALCAIPPRLEAADAHARARRHGQTSLTRLAAALGVEPAWNPFAGLDAGSGNA